MSGGEDVEFWSNYIDFSRPSFVIVVVVIVINVLAVLVRNGKNKK